LQAAGRLEAFGSPCHEGARDPILRLREARKRAEEKDDAVDQSKFSSSRSDIRDARRDGVGGWAMEGSVLR
jgi:hypothetical protein